MEFLADAFAASCWWAMASAFFCRHSKVYSRKELKKRKKPQIRFHRNSEIHWTAAAGNNYSQDDKSKFRLPGYFSSFLLFFAWYNEINITLRESKVTIRTQQFTFSNTNEPAAAVSACMCVCD